jgi:hypothetical protein
VSRYGYWVDLVGQQLGDSSWVHALPIGEFEHPVYGKMNFTPERVQKFAASVKGRVRGIDLDVDYDHKEHGGQAAGWVRDADVRPDGLYLQVEWTPRASEAIKNREYRYFSPEFDDTWKDAGGTEHQDVLFGGALTNRPFLKDLLPVNLSEITTNAKKANEGGQMGPEQIRELLGLGTDATDEQVTAKIAELKAGAPAPPPPSPTPPAPTPPETEPVLTGAALNEAIAKALGEHPMLVELRRSLDATRAAQQFAETRQRLERLQVNQGGRQFVLPPAVIDAVAEGSSLSDPVAMSQKFVDAIEAFGRVGYVELGERGRTRNGTEKTASQQLSELVTAAQTQHMAATGKQLSTTNAIAQVVRANPELYLAYREDSYSGREE